MYALFAKYSTTFSQGRNNHVMDTSAPNETIINLESSDLAATIGNMKINDQAMFSRATAIVIANLESSGLVTTIGNMDYGEKPGGR